MESQVIQQAVGSGIAGVILLVIIYPLFTWLKAKVDKKDKYIEDLVNTHLRNNEQSRQQLITAVQVLQNTVHDLPKKTLETIQNKYPDGDYALMKKAAQRILATPKH